MSDPFANIVGQTAAIALLNQVIRRDRVAPAYLFAGPSGVGRKLVARGFTELLLRHQRPLETYELVQQKVQKRNHPDLFWVEPTYLHQGKRITVQEAETLGIKRKTQPQIRVEQIREITEFLSRPPLEATRCVVVIEEAQTMAEAAANALLKTLEEPGRATLILIAPSSASLLPTLVSRCQRIPFYRLAQNEVLAVLRDRAPAELLANETLVAIAQGSPGEALRAWAEFQQLDAALLNSLHTWPKTPKEALFLAKDLAQTLELDTQLWLLDYLQFYHWHCQQQAQQVQSLETAQQQLRFFAQPRLVWECLFLSELAI